MNKNTEQFAVVKKRNGMFVNAHMRFEGTATQAVEFAKLHGFGGGVVEYHKGIFFKLDEGAADYMPEHLEYNEPAGDE